MQKTVNEDNNLSVGLVIAYFGSSVAVEAADGQVFQCHLKRNQTLPVVGDRVTFKIDANGDQGTVVSVEPRSSQLGRGDGRGNMKVIAANVDNIIIVMAPPPIFSEYLIDRYMVAAELLQIAPILVINKCDLMNEKQMADLKARLACYEAIPYTVICTSVKTGVGMETLLQQFQHKASVLVGPSGVGKSSIIGAIGKHDDIRIGAVSEKGSGKHTTTATRLYHLPTGGKLIDSPGVREFNLWPIPKADVIKGFKEFNVIRGCRFNDCQHGVEPGCAVQTALADGKISSERYVSYQTLLKEAEAIKPYK